MAVLEALYLEMRGGWVVTRTNHMTLYWSDYQNSWTNEYYATLYGCMERAEEKLEDLRITECLNALAGDDNVDRWPEYH